jgi:hypothetical protein
LDRDALAKYRWSSYRVAFLFLFQLAESPAGIRQLTLEQPTRSPDLRLWWDK